MTDDAKPDALEELKRQHAVHHAPGCLCVEGEAIAAWEKERADATRQQRAEIYNKLLVLRTAVEKVRDELIQTINVRPGAVMACHLREAADALDAALRGGA